MLEGFHLEIVLIILPLQFLQQHCSRGFSELCMNLCVRFVFFIIGHACKALHRVRNRTGRAWMERKRVNERRSIGWASLTELGQCEAEAKNCTTTRPYHSVQTFRGGGGIALGHSVIQTGFSSSYEGHCHLVV